MRDTQAEFSALLQRFNGMSRSDRKAVLANLNPEDRVVLENAVALETRAQAAERARKRQADRQYLGYSPWLAELVETAVKQDGCELAPAAAKAVATEHASLIAAMGTAPREGWRGIVDWIQDHVMPGNGANL